VLPTAARVDWRYAIDSRRRDRIGDVRRARADTVRSTRATRRSRRPGALPRYLRTSGRSVGHRHPRLGRPEHFRHPRYLGARRARPRSFARRPVGDRSFGPFIFGPPMST
jgi:hypothetical protein